jgi:hypothetical protein
MPIIDRSTPEGFARRTRKNLEFIKASGNPRAHIVTQITLSMLGIVVFPWERHGLVETDWITIAETEERGWPQWKITLGEATTITVFHLLEHLRNAIAHGLWSFDSDDRDPSKVLIKARDAISHDAPISWKASIRADDLDRFLICLLDYFREYLKWGTVFEDA